MAQGCGPSCARIILIIFNIIFWLSGCALVALGLFLIFGGNFNVTFEYVQYVQDLIPGATQSLIEYAAYAIIGIGAFVIIVGFCGCCGAIKESQCLLGFYIFFLVIIMLAEIAVGAFMIFFREDILSEASEQFPKVMTDEYASANNSALRGAVNQFQIEFKCCGWNGMDDFVNVTYDGATGIVPSCCVINDTSTLGDDWSMLTYAQVDDGSSCMAKAGGFYVTTCKEAITDWIDEYSYILIGVGIGIACLELFGIIFACCLCRNVGE